MSDAAPHRDYLTIGDRKPRTYGRKRVNRAARPTDMVHGQLRTTDALRARIEEAATLNGTSMNAEIVRRLEQSFWLDDLIRVGIATRPDNG